MPTHKKMYKIEAVAVEKSQPDGVIRFRADKPATMEEDECQSSSDVEVKGVPWRAIAGRRGGKFYISLEYMTAQSTPWRIDVNAEYVLIHSDANKNISVEHSSCFNNTMTPDTDYGVDIMDWDEFIEDKEGFIKNGKVTVEIRVWISDMKGVKTVPRVDFTDSDDRCHDIALIIDGKKIYASKQYLSSYSPVFKAMFYGDFVEKDKNEIELKDVNRDEFIDLLYVIYPACKKITGDSAEYLLKLGDMFQIACVMDRTEKYLIESELFTNMEKLRIANQYRVFGLMEHCLSELRNKQDFTNIKKSAIYSDLSFETKALLFERLHDVAN